VYQFFQTVNYRPLRGWNSLSANAYRIYVVHYGFVTWLQFALLPINVPVVVKFLIVFWLL
jgi:glucan biosynthesis protein C